MNLILNYNPNLNITKKELKKLFLFAKSQTHFIFNSKFYNQIDEVAMERDIMAGSRTAVLFPLPSIFSEFLEDSTLSFWQTRGTAQGLKGLGQRYFSCF